MVGWPTKLILNVLYILWMGLSQCSMHRKELISIHWKIVKITDIAAAVRGKSVKSAKAMIWHSIQ